MKNSFCEITLNYNPSILDNLELKEHVDTNVLDKLIHSTLLKNKFNNPMAKVHQTEKNQLIKYKNLITNDGYALVRYNRVKNMNCGRVNPKNSLGLFSIRREIRHTLAKQRYVDLDIDNCHPVILNQILKQNNKESKYLDSYVKDRKKWLNMVCEHYNIKGNEIQMKEIPKALFIRIMYGGGLKSWMEEFKIDSNIKPFDELKKFIKEIKKTMEYISNENTELQQLIISKKKEAGETEYNLNGSLCSYYLQTKECEILESIYIYCKSKSLIINDSCVLCADGLMIEADKYYPELLDEFKSNIMERFNIDVNFSKKEMNQDYMDILDDNLNFKLYDEIVTTGLIANYFKIMFSNQFMVVQDKLYKYTGVYWCLDESKKSTSLHQFISNTFYKHMVSYCISQKSMLFNERNDMTNEDDIKAVKDKLQKLNKFEETINTFCNHVQNRNHLVDDIKHSITKYNIVLDNKPFLFAFTNKIYDLQNKKFITPSYDMYITITCGYDYEDFYSNDNTNELNRIIDTIFTNPQVKDYYLQCLSTGLYGSQVENLFIGTGAGGNGKSLLNSLMMKAIGQYGYKIPSSTLLAPIKDGGNPQIANLDKKRFALAQEPDKNKAICSSTMKELTGDDNINTRKLYSGECEVKLTLSLFLE